MSLNLYTCNKAIGGFVDDRFWSEFDMKLWTFNVNFSIPSDYSELFSKKSECVKGLNFGSNRKVNFLPIKVYEKFPNIVALNAYECSLKEIRYDNFEKLVELRTLALQYNQISFIPSDSFKDLRNLKHLRLGENQIQSIDEKLFQNLNNLKELNLYNNRISVIPTNALASLTELQNITLSYNKINELNSGHFKNNKKLERVWMENNKITSLSPAMFDDMKNLILVNMRDNNCINYDFCDTFYVCSFKFSELNSKIKSNC